MADTERDYLVSRIYLRSVLPLTKIILDETPWLKKAVSRMNATVQFCKLNSDLGAYLEFKDSQLDVHIGIHPRPTVRFGFKTAREMNALFAGKLALPRLRGLRHPLVIAATLPLLLGLKILMPDALPTDPEKRALKVKLTLFMITNALSQLNKGGDEDFQAIVKKSPDRIYQWTVEGGPAAYLRMKAGKTKAGRGTYTRRRPFIHMKFPDIDSAFMVLTSQVSMIDAITKKMLVTEGPPEQSKDIGMHMMRVEQLIT